MAIPIPRSKRRSHTPPIRRPRASVVRGTVGKTAGKKAGASSNRTNGKPPLVRNRLRYARFSATVRAVPFQGGGPTIAATSSGAAKYTTIPRSASSKVTRQARTNPGRKPIVPEQGDDAIVRADLSINQPVYQDNHKYDCGMSEREAEQLGQARQIHQDQHHRTDDGNDNLKSVNWIDGHPGRNTRQRVGQSRRRSAETSADAQIKATNGHGGFGRE